MRTSREPRKAQSSALIALTREPVNKVARVVTAQSNTTDSFLNAHKDVQGIVQERKRAVAEYAAQLGVHPPNKKGIRYAVEDGDYAWDNPNILRLLSMLNLLKAAEVELRTRVNALYSLEDICVGDAFVVLDAEGDLLYSDVVRAFVKERFFVGGKNRVRFLKKTARSQGLLPVYRKFGYAEMRKEQTT